jgi:hypothetical protein
VTLTGQKEYACESKKAACNKSSKPPNEEAEALIPHACMSVAEYESPCAHEGLQLLELVLDRRRFPQLGLSEVTPGSNMNAAQVADEVT